jgi:dTDP-4-amino-4,6-dideoxygalactose transaminase
MVDKSCLDSLAIFGGVPAFDVTLHVGCPNVGNRERLLSRINDLLDRRWLTNNGPFVQEFEREIAKKIGVRHCIAICNGTVALEIAIRALDLTGEVIVPSFTFIATVHALRWQRIRPVFCDLDPKTHNIDPASVESLITPRTTGIIGVHLWGRPCQVESLQRFADSHGLKLLYDAAHAFGCSYKGRMIGNFGDAEVFSFHATKILNSFEGGAIVTNNNDLATKLRLMKNFGFSGYDNVIYTGTNGKMSEVAAAMGLTSLESFDEFISIYRRNYRLYQERLKHLPGVHVTHYDENERCNYQYIALEVDERITEITRDALVEILWAENVIARRYFYPGCHRMEPYHTLDPDAAQRLHFTERLARRVLLLPTGTSVGPEHIETICGILQLVVRNGSEAQTRVRQINSTIANRASTVNRESNATTAH